MTLDTHILEVEDLSRRSRWSWGARQTEPIPTCLSLGKKINKNKTQVGRVHLKATHDVLIKNNIKHI